MAPAFKLYYGQGCCCLGVMEVTPSLPLSSLLFPLLLMSCFILMTPCWGRGWGTLAIGRFGLTNHHLKTREGKKLSHTLVRKISGGFPNGPVVRTPPFHCRGPQAGRTRISAD